MKKIILIICATFLGLVQMNAQIETRYGGKAGFSISGLSGDSSLGYYSKPGLYFGAALELSYRDKIIIQPEALFSLHSSGAFFQDNINLWYLNVPVLIKYNVWEDLYIEAGPYLGLLFADNFKPNPLTPSDLNSLDYGLSVGAGYSLDEDLYLQVRYNAGFTDVIENLSSKNRSFQLSLIYFLWRRR